MLPAAIVEAERGTLTSQRAMLVLSVAGGAWTFFWLMVEALVCRGAALVSLCSDNAACTDALRV